MTTEAFDKQTATKIIQSFEARAEMLVQILHEFVARFGWISEAAIRQLAEELNLARAEVHGVVSYYHDFRTEAPGKHIVKICEAEACQAMGSRGLSAHAQKSLGIEMHSNNTDVTLEPVYCLGNCACSPSVRLDDQVLARVDAARLDELLAELDQGRE